mmetsp:Transcript_7665/g.15936  ORF Transcript_7665/g.15936 Transcript_7665/m.15936 type:complete len:174 (-) Transcript_7665:36-557(-)
MVRQKSRHILVSCSHGEDLPHPVLADLIYENIRKCLSTIFGDWTRAFVDSNRNGLDVRLLFDKRFNFVVVKCPRTYARLVRCALALLSPLDVTLVRQRYPGLQFLKEVRSMPCRFDVVSVHGLAVLAEREAGRHCEGRRAAVLGSADILPKRVGSAGWGEKRRIVGRSVGRIT